MIHNIRKIVEVLNDLIRINKDREEGYVKAGHGLTPAEHNLRGVFERKAQESRNNVLQLQHKAEEMIARNEVTVDDGTISGALYRVWMDLTNAFASGDADSILQSCASGEKAAQQCYADILDKEELPEDVSNIIREQKRSIDESHHEIRSLLRKD